MGLSQVLRPISDYALEIEDCKLERGREREKEREKEGGGEGEIGI